MRAGHEGEADAELPEEPRDWILQQREGDFMTSELRAELHTSPEFQPRYAFPRSAAATVTLFSRLQQLPLSTQRHSFKNETDVYCFDLNHSVRNSKVEPFF